MDTTLRPQAPRVVDEHGIDRKLELARKELLEISTRSRLLSAPLGSARANILEVVGRTSEDLFRILVRDGKAARFLGVRGSADQPHDLQPEDLEEPGAPEYRGGRDPQFNFQTSLAASKLHRRLRSIARDAQEFEDERGVSVLYLALGFLQWFDSKDLEKPRHAPLLLLPATLRRVASSGEFQLEYSGGEIATNLSLLERLKEDGLVLPALPDVEELSPQAYAASVARAIDGKQRWEVRSDVAVLGLFSFAKLMMFLDLKPERWPEANSIRRHILIKGLLEDGFGVAAEPFVPDDAAVDPVIDVATAGHVVDADSSQMVAIQEVLAGRNLVIQGPPGTGKSQTITNLIAIAVREGRRVLFVAEKMAALNVVRENLNRIGLGHLSLELHSHKANKKAVLQDLQETFEAGVRAAPETAIPEQQLRAARDLLNAHAGRMHTPLEPSGITPFQAFAKLGRLGDAAPSAPDFKMPQATDWSAFEIEERARRLERLAAHAGAMGPFSEHSWRGTRAPVSLPADATRLVQAAGRIAADLGNCVETGQGIARRLNATWTTVDGARRLVRFGDACVRAPALDAIALGQRVWQEERTQIGNLVSAGRRYATAKRRLATVVLPAAWDNDQSALRKVLARDGASWFRRLGGTYRRSVRDLAALCAGAPPQSLADKLELLDSLAVGRMSRDSIRAADALGRTAFGTAWRGDESDWDQLVAIEAWEQATQDAGVPEVWHAWLAAIENLPEFGRETVLFGQNLESVFTALAAYCEQLAFDCSVAFGSPALDAVPVDALLARLQAQAASPAALRAWSDWLVWSHDARAVDLAAPVEQLAAGHVAPAHLADFFRYACHEALVQQALAQFPELQGFDGRAHDHVVDQFKALDRARMALARQETIDQHARNLPQGTAEIGEMGVLMHEWQKKMRHLPLRKLIQQAGHAMQHIKPVWMMSPMSLAQYVEPGALEFDLIVMDEASQVRPVEALGAVARGRQMVVVGDEKQLPPTSFFDRVAGDDGEAAEDEDFQVTDVESILGLSLAQGIPARMLRWHYRSQHESLIAVSNLEFYKKLFIVPSATSEDLGLRLHRIAGVYDRGHSATNRIEAQAVVRAAIEHAEQYQRSARFPAGMSLGVGTFSVAQRDAILDELEVALRGRADLEEFFDPDADEPFFVKNLESIQGDERDVILISVGYGHDAQGSFTMNFGPLSASGGERRLNVLISRARRRCEVFTSIGAEDIDLERSDAVGVRVLKTFLHYAATGILDRSEIAAKAPDSDFELDVGGALARLGYDVRYQVGVAGFYVDLAIGDPQRPGVYTLGIECDGAAYHRSRSARDRDRLREQVLRDRAWRIHRIWSTDWFHRREAELGRVVAAIEAARAAVALPVAAPPQADATESVDVEPRSRGGSGAATERLTHDRIPVLAYVEADFHEPHGVEPHEVPLQRRVAILVRIIEVEEPIHEDEIARRYAMVCGRERAGSRIQAATQNGLARALRDGAVVARGSFYMRREQPEYPLRDRSATVSLTLRMPDMIAPMELQWGLRRVVADQVGVEPEAAITEVARMLGFQRTGQDVRRVIEAEIEQMVQQGALVQRNGGRLFIP